MSKTQADATVAATIRERSFSYNMHEKDTSAVGHHVDYGAGCSQCETKLGQRNHPERARAELLPPVAVRWKAFGVKSGLKLCVCKPRGPWCEFESGFKMEIPG